MSDRDYNQPRTYLPPAMPGPMRHGNHLLPTPLPAGVLPPEDSRLWVFTAKAVQGGENFIQDDTREWFADRDNTIQICREYSDHPRWLIKGKDSVRAKMFNSHIVSEIHMLARIHKGLPDVPDWVPARMTVKQQQADLAYRLTKFTRATFLRKGADALEAFADKAPGQFIKFVGSTFIPKKIEAQITDTASEALTREDADALMVAVVEELKRREVDAKLVVHTPLDFEDLDVNIADTLQQTGLAIHNATEANLAVGSSKDIGSPNGVRALSRVRDIEADKDNVLRPPKIKVEPKDEEWG